MLLVGATFLVFPAESVESTRRPIEHVGCAFNRWVMSVIFLLKNANVLISNILSQPVDGIFASRNAMGHIRCIANGLVIMHVHHSSGVSKIVLLEV